MSQTVAKSEVEVLARPETRVSMQHNALIPFRVYGQTSQRLLLCHHVMTCMGFDALGSSIGKNSRIMCNEVKDQTVTHIEKMDDPHMA